MPIPQEKLHRLIKNSFPNSDVKIIALVPDNNHYSVTITDQSFVGKTRVEQHKMVNKALENVLGDELHALQIKTLMPS